MRQLRERDREFGYVQDTRRRFHGVVSVESLMSAIERGNGSTTLDDALLPGIEPITDDLPMEEVLPRVASSACPLPVVNGQGAYVGAISKTAYLETLGGSR